MLLQHWIGIFAAACTTLSFVPQIVKIRKQGGADLSFYMLFIFFSGTVFWLIYGLMLHAPEIIWANAVSAVLVASAIGLKVTHPNRRAIAAEAAQATAAQREPVSARYIERDASWSRPGADPATQTAAPAAALAHPS
jgi:MtN3 and saliva related transmembrane protein